MQGIAAEVAISSFSGILATEGPDVNCDTSQQSWVEIWARRIETSGFSTAVLSVIEIVRAFGFVGSQALLLVQPLMAGFVSETTLERSVALLSSPELLDQLQMCLEGEEN